MEASRNSQLSRVNETDRYGRVNLKPKIGIGYFGTSKEKLDLNLLVNKPEKTFFVSCEFFKYFVAWVTTKY